MTVASASHQPSAANPIFYQSPPRKLFMLMRASPTDFAYLEDHQRDIDARLRNWSRWCFSGQGGEIALLLRAAHEERDDGRTATIAVDVNDAVKIQKAVSVLPEKHRKAINWQYVLPSPPRRKAQELAVSLDGLQQLVRDGRQMLINRKA